MFLCSGIPCLAYSYETTYSSTSNGTWLYVGGSGPGNYTKIQDALDNASDGDTIFVFDDLSPYTEPLSVIDKQVTLLGESRNTTIINSTYTIYINADFVTIKDFTINNELRSYVGGMRNLTIEQNILCNSIESYDCSNLSIIENTILRDIHVSGCTNTTISWNTFSCMSSCGANLRCLTGTYVYIANNIFQDALGLSGYYCHLYDIKDCVVSNNIFQNHSVFVGLNIEDSTRIDISGNFFINMVTTGLMVAGSSYVYITRNHFQNISLNAVYLRSPLRVKVIENNFIHPSECGCFLGFASRWERNYWGEPRVLPKPIHAWSEYLVFDFIGVNIPVVYKFDWHPAKEPYDM